MVVGAQGEEPAPAAVAPPPEAPAAKPPPIGPKRGTKVIPTARCYHSASFFCAVPVHETLVAVKRMLFMIWILTSLG